MALLAALELAGRDAVDWPLVAGLCAVSAALGVPALAPPRATPGSILRLDGFAVRSFAVCMGAGTLFRAAVSAVPFLLPLLFQVGFGLDAFRSGLLVLALFLGNVGMKPLTTAVLKRFGFKRVFVADAALAALAILALAALSPATPLPLTLLVLAAAGATRSMGLTTINTLAFAEIAPDAMGPPTRCSPWASSSASASAWRWVRWRCGVAEAWRPAGALHATRGSSASPSRSSPWRLSRRPSTPAVAGRGRRRGGT